jgi:hypothetical protein
MFSLKGENEFASGRGSAQPRILQQTLAHTGIFVKDPNERVDRRKKKIEGSKRGFGDSFYEKIAKTKAAHLADAEENRINECNEKTDDYTKALTEGIKNLSIGSSPELSDLFNATRSRDRQRRLKRDFRDALRKHREQRQPEEPREKGPTNRDEVRPLEVDVDGFDEGELDDFLKAVYDFTEAELASDLSVFKDAHELTYEHCKLRNLGAEAEATAAGASSFASSMGVLNAIGAADSFVDQESAPGGLPDPNTISGDERLALFRSLLDEFNWERQDNQVDFHEMMIKTALPCIFEKEWDSDYDRILRMFDLYQHCAETFIVCPRRFGKTVAVAMFCAVYMYVIPNASIAIFSTAQRTSGKMMLAIYEFMRELPYFKEATFNVKNSETINITLNGIQRTMWCYPGKVGV